MPGIYLPRRTFLKTGGAAILSVFVRPGVMSSAEGPQKEHDLVLRPDDQNGFFSIGSGPKPLIQHAFIRVELDGEVCNSYDGRYQTIPVERGLLFRDARRKCDMLLQSGELASVHGMTLALKVKNASEAAMGIKQIWPVIALSERGGGMQCGEHHEDVRILTDEWERCYGNGGVHPLDAKQKHESAWDIHCFDPARGQSLSLSYLDIPNAMLSFSLEHRGSGESVDLVIAADTRAGDQAVQVSPGESFSLGAIAIIVQQGNPVDTLITYARVIAAHNHIEVRGAPPTGWVDWYFAKGNISGQDILDNIEIIAREFKEFGLEYIQIDSGWQRGIETSPPPHNVVAGGPWEPNSKFPRGMKWFAERIRAAGFKPGLWIRPFQAVKGAPEREEHPEWFNADGQMDISLPAVRNHVGGITRTVVQDWGYDYVKYDFAAYDLFNAWGPKLFDHHAAVPEPHVQSLTSLQAYSKSISAIHDAAKGKARLLACNGVMPVTLGLADAFRIGDDVGDWERTLRMGVGSTAARFYTHGSFWWNDPDCLLVREPFTLEQARMWASLIAQTGGVVFISEDLRKLPGDRLSIIKKVLPVYVPGTLPYSYATPVDFLEHNPPEVWNLKVKRKFGSWNILGLYNWTDASKSVHARRADLDLPSDGAFSVYEFWRQEFAGDLGAQISAELGPFSCRIFSVHRSMNHPHLLGTSRHVTQGGVEMEDLRWEERAMTLSGDSRVILGNPYSVAIRIPAPYRVVAVEGAKVQDPGEGALVRLDLPAEKTGTYGWKVRFKK